eukprot:gene10128-6941_t
MADAGSTALEDQFSPDSVQHYSTACKLPQLQFTDKIVSGKIPDRSRCAKRCLVPGCMHCGEGVLDIENMHMTAPSVPLQYWTGKHDDFLTWITAVNDDKDAALTGGRHAWE